MVSRVSCNTATVEWVGLVTVTLLKVLIVFVLFYNF